MRLPNRGSQAARGGADPPPAADHGGVPVAASGPEPASAGRPAAAQPAAEQPSTHPVTAEQPATTPPATEQPAAADPAAQPPPAQPPPAPPHHVIRRTRASGLWVGLALSAIVLLLLLVFILENQQSANIGYFGAHGQLPLGVALLLAAVAGALLVVIPGSARIMQLRATARRHRKTDAQARGSGPPPPPPPGQA